MSSAKIEVPIQKTLFTFICLETGHSFGVVGEGYYKQVNDEADKSKVFRVILCPQCGEAREICIVDRTISNGKLAKTKITRRKTKRGL